MPVKIRLARRGRKKKPYYHIIVADSRAPRDGRYIEKLGSYNPMIKPASIELDNEKTLDWLMKGAQPTDTARAILKFRGVLYRKHLLRGVEKGAFDQEEADRLYREFLDNKEAKTQARIEETAREMEAFRLKVFGSVTKESKGPARDEEALAKFQEKPVDKVSTKEVDEVKTEAVDEVKAEAGAEDKTELEAEEKTETIAEAKEESAVEETSTEEE